MNPLTMQRWLGAGLAGFLAVSTAQALPPAEELVPASTRGFVSAPQVPRFRAAWEKTPLAGMLNDPAMQPYRKEAQAKIDKGEAVMTWYLGLTADDIWEAGAGEVAVAVISDAGETPALVLILDVAGKTAEADKVLRRAGDRLIAGGAIQTEPDVGGSKAAAYELPAVLVDGAIQRYFYLRQGDCLLASTSAPAAAGILGRLKGGAPGTLAGVAAFRETTGLAQKDIAGAHVRWFVEPLAFWKAVRVLRDQKPKEKPDRLEVYQAEGFQAIRGIGGAALLSTAEYHVLARNYVHAPRPYEGAMRMLDFPDVKFDPPPAWVPGEAAGCLALSMKYLPTFNAYSTLFDRLYGEGEQIFEDIIAATSEAPDGPQVNLRKAVIGALQGPVWRLRLNVQPEKPTQWLVAARVAEEKPLATALKRLFAGDDEIKPLPFGDHGMWQFLPPPKDQKRKEVKLWGLPPSAVTVARQHLMVAETPDLLRSLGMPANPLQAAPGYRDLMTLLDKIGSPTGFLRGMVRNQDQFRDALAELRSGPSDAEGYLTKLLRAALVPYSGRGKQAVDLNKLPTFDKLGQQPWGESGIHGINRDSGWLLLLATPKKPG